MLHTDMEMQTKRLCLRPVTLQDAFDLQTLYCDKRVMDGNAEFSCMDTIEEIQEFLRPYCSSHATPHILTLVLEIKEKRSVIGILQLHQTAAQEVELSYLLKHAYWRMGYMKEALYAVLYHFAPLTDTWVFADVEKTNVASQKLLLSLGFSYQGLQKRYCLRNNGNDDALQHYVWHQDKEDE